MATASQIMRYVNGLLWLGTTIFLIWFIAVELDKTTDESNVLIRSEKEDSLRFPAVLLCPVAEAVEISDSPLITVNTSSPAVIDSSGPFLDTDDERSTYFVCPAVVEFHATVNGKQRTVQCMDFSQRPEAVAAPATPTCSGLPTDRSTWFQLATNPIAPKVPWTATGRSSSVLLPLFTSHGFQAEPVQALLYSSKTEVQPPTDFQSYARIFSITSERRVSIPLGGTVAVHVDHHIRNPIGSNSASNCDEEYFESTADILRMDKSAFTHSNTNFQQMVLTYNRLITFHQCNGARFTFWDILGVVGGCIAIAVTVTLMLGRFAKHVLDRSGLPKDSHEADIQTAGYGQL